MLTRVHKRLQIFYRIRKFPTRLFFFILIITIILLKPKIFLGLKDFTSGVLTKPFEFFSNVKNYFVRVKYISGENLVLKQRLGALSVALARLKEADLENERLRAILNFSKSLRYRTIVAKVIVRDSVDWRKAIIINRGRKDGIRERMPCATTNGLIGRVVEVGPASSKVMLITDPNSKVGVILESSRESGVLVGLLQGACKVIYLSLDGEIKPGERVLTAGFSTFLPKGLAIGEITQIGIEKTGLYKYAIVRPFEDMSKIEEIMCIDTGD